MTEQPDTAAIRERWAAWSPAPMAPGGTILALCDALDDARTERDDLAEVVGHCKVVRADWEDAESRAEAAEARIAAALDSHANHAMHAYSDCACVGCLMRNALLP